ncbi:MAG: endonuclease/exonuclease/phosphatase family protein [bacterium]
MHFSGFCYKWCKSIFVADFLFLSLIYIVGCIWPGRASNPGSPAVNLKIITWNLEHFGSNNDSTIRELAAAMLKMDCDLFCLQEIENTDSFDVLLSYMPGYSGICSPDTYSDTTWYQKTGLIYRNDYIKTDSVKSIFTESPFPFIRPPLQVKINAGQFFDFYLIEWHLKSHNAGYQKNAVEDMKFYLDSLIRVGEEKDVILLGDWNCEIYWNTGNSPLYIFKNDSENYIFLTDSLEKNNRASHISGSFWDHILVSSGVLEVYGNNITEVIAVDSITDIKLSDHFPVMAEFKQVND